VKTTDSEGDVRPRAVADPAAVRDTGTSTSIEDGTVIPRSGYLCDAASRRVGTRCRELVPDRLGRRRHHDVDGGDANTPAVAPVHRAIASLPRPHAARRLCKKQAR
jgi:hypothetical protein